jgi:hypothetical protein
MKPFVQIGNLQRWANDRFKTTAKRETGSSRRRRKVEYPVLKIFMFL